MTTSRDTGNAAETDDTQGGGRGRWHIPLMASHSEQINRQMCVFEFSFKGAGGSEITLNLNLKYTWERQIL